MSDIVDNVMNAVNDASESVEEVVVNEEVEVAPEPENEPEPASEPEPTPEPASEPEPTPETAPEPEPASEPEPAPEPEPTPEPAPEPENEPEPEPVTTQEVVQNIQGILSSTDNKLLVDNSELEERVKSLEEKLDKLITLLKSRRGLNDLQRGRNNI
jgi:outer membrane biosynthesis protein TonB